MRTVSFLLLLLSLWGTSLSVQSQTTYTAFLRRYEAGKGMIVINQSAQIEQIVNNVLPATHNTPSHEQAVQRPDRQESRTVTHPDTDNTRNKTASEHSLPANRENHESTAGHAASDHRTHVNRLRHKARGYRICIFTGGNTRADKTRALQMGQKCRQKFPELATYTSFIAPRWVTHVGDFKTQQEAQKYVRLIRRAHFTYEVRIIGSEVNLPY